MATIENSIFVRAPVHRVFDYMAEPKHLLEIWPSLLDVRNVQPLPNGGFCYEWTYKLAGIRFEGKAEWTEFVKDSRIVYVNEGGIPSKFVWNYLPEDGGTRVRINVDYTVPGRALARLAEPVIHRMNVHESSTILANLKARIEG